eukprot:gene33674-41546_t
MTIALPMTRSEVQVLVTMGEMTGAGQVVATGLAVTRSAVAPVQVGNRVPSAGAQVQVVEVMVVAVEAAEMAGEVVGTSNKVVVATYNRVEAALEDTRLVSDMRNSPQCSDAAILRVINPPTTDRDRSLLLNQNEETPFIPQISEARLDGTVGLKLNDKFKVRANHFQVKIADLPSCIHQHSVSIIPYRGKDGDNTKYEKKDDLCQSVGEEKIDLARNSTILKAFRDLQPELNQSQLGPVGVAYDGAAILYTSRSLNLPLVCGAGGIPQHSLNAIVDWPGNPKVKFSVTVTHVKDLPLPRRDPVSGAMTWNLKKELGDKYNHREALTALNAALMYFAQWDGGHSWIVNGSKAFRTDGPREQLNRAFIALTGYYASLKACVSGLTLVADISVTCFLAGGDMIDVMANVRGCSATDLINESKHFEQAMSSLGLSQESLDVIEKVLKGVKFTLKHLKLTKKFKSFGPAANSRDSIFRNALGVDLTVEQYYIEKCATDPLYKAALPSGRLLHPYLPTINAGSKNKPILIPVELARVKDGQTRQRAMNGEMSAKIIKIAAKLPNDRANYVTNPEQGGLKCALAGDRDAASFGLSTISAELMRLEATVLPLPKLKYQAVHPVLPILNGSWRLDGCKFALPAVKCNFAIVTVHENERPPNNLSDVVSAFDKQIIVREAQSFGVPLSRIPLNHQAVRGGPRSTGSDLSDAFNECKEKNIQIVFVMLAGSFYDIVKLGADSVKLSTQCLRWQRCETPPRDYHRNVMLKVNAKLGGVNHTMASRGVVDQTAPATFQSPPQSMSWLLDEECMVVGIDIAHPDASKPGELSVAAMVASMDGKLGQYCAHISTSRTRGQEVNDTLGEPFVQLLTVFRARNCGRWPKRIIVYRDGVSDGEFDKVVVDEVGAMKSALEDLGHSEHTMPIAVVVCQKRHHTRLFYENADGKLGNSCAGLCTDARNGHSESGAALHSIVSPSGVEFYLNSHGEGLGTSKSCRYTLIYDEIGFKLS